MRKKKSKRFTDFLKVDPKVFTHLAPKTPTGSVQDRAKGCLLGMGTPADYSVFVKTSLGTFLNTEANVSQDIQNNRILTVTFARMRATKPTTIEQLVVMRDGEVLAVEPSDMVLKPDDELAPSYSITF